MSERAAVWQGSPADLCALRAAVERNCTCDWDEGWLKYECAAHRMLNDQNILNHMVYVATIREKLFRREQSTKKLPFGL